ncbi:MAG: small basic family protein [Armatimonadetes bacterium]|nr:small basic family protein [Armatimonadota bacterium]
MVWLPILALVAGFLLVWLSRWSVSGDYASYLGLAALAGLDSVFGGIRAGLEGKFHTDVFVSGFIANTLLAASLAWLGDQIGVDLLLAAVVALGGRVFLNLSLIRRYWLTQVSFARRRDSN